MARLLYRRRIFIFFILVISVTSLASLIVFNLDQSKLKKKSHQINVERQINYIKHNLNNQLIIIFNYLARLRGSNEIYLWGGSSDQEYYYFMRKVQDMLNNEQLPLELIDYNLAISFKGERETLITANESIGKFNYFKDYGFSSTQVTNMELKIKNKSNTQRSLLEVSEKETGEKFIHYIIDSNFYRQDLVFYLTISMDSIMDILGYIEGDWLIANDEDIFFKTPGIDNKYDDFFINSLQKLDKTRDKALLGNKEITNSLVYWFDMPMVNWKFIFLSEVEKYKINDFTVYILLPLICILILSYYISQFLSNNLYKPITQVINQFSSEDHKYDSSDEFEWIIHEAENLKSTNRMMKNLVEYNTTLLQEHKLKEFLLGYSINIDKLDLQEFNLDSCYNIVLLELKNDENDILNNEKIEISREIIRDHKYLFPDSLFFPIEKNLFALISRDKQISYLRNNLSRIVAIIEETCSADFHISIGKKVKGYKNIPNSYKDAKQILEYKYLLGQKLILTSDLIENECLSKTIYYPLSVENRIITLSVKGDDKVISTVNELLNENFNERRLVKDERKKLVISIKATITRIFHELKQSPDFVFKENLKDFEKMEENWYQEEINKKILGLFRCIIDRINYENNREKDELKEQMLLYIKENYNDDIMLNDMAEELNISFKYCSAVFKKLIGQNFKDYLNHFRVEKAKEILDSNPGIKIGNLAFQVGFNSSNTFIRVFKKYVGESPGCYIKKK